MHSTDIDSFQEQWWEEMLTFSIVQVSSSFQLLYRIVLRILCLRYIILYYLLLYIFLK